MTNNPLIEKYEEIYGKKEEPKPEPIEPKPEPIEDEPIVSSNLCSEISLPKSPAEKAYCEVYGEYPRSGHIWNGFLTGYDLGYIHGAEGKDKFVPHQEHFGLKLGN